MAITKEIIIKADTGDAVTSVDNLSTSIEGVGDAAKDSSKKISGIKKAAKTASTGFKAIGTAFKAMGIGIIVALFAKLAEILSKNQKVMDILSNVMTSLEIAFNDLFSFISENFMPAFEKLKKFFAELTFDKIKKAIQDNIIERFNSVLDVIGFVGTAFKELFAGNFDKALEAIGNAGKEMVDVMTGVPNTVDKVTDVIVEGSKAIANYTKETFKAAEAMTELSNRALIAEAINRGLIEQYDRQAEQQRQIRDDESKTIEQRIAANKKLGEILEEQQKTMLENAELAIQAAQNAFDLNGNTENEIALIDAKSEKLAILAQIEGFRSEQLINTISLLKEQGDIEQATLDSSIAAAAEKKKIADEEQAKRDKDAAEEIQLAQNVANAKLNIASSLSGLIGQLVEQDSALGKGLAVAQATISGFQGVQNAFTTASDSPITKVFPAYPFIQAGIAGAFSAVQIKNILKVNPKTGAGGGGQSSGGGGGGAAAPSFNLVEGTGTNQIAEGLSRQDKPIKAFVVSGDVTTSQSLDRNIVENSSL